MNAYLQTLCLNEDLYLENETLLRLGKCYLVLHDLNLLVLWNNYMSVYCAQLMCFNNILRNGIMLEVYTFVNIPVHSSYLFLHRCGFLYVLHSLSPCQC